MFTIDLIILAFLPRPILIVVSHTHAARNTVYRSGDIIYRNIYKVTRLQRRITMNVARLYAYTIRGKEHNVTFINTTTRQLRDYLIQVLKIINRVDDVN